MREKDQTPMNTPLIDISNLNKWYDDFHVLKDINVTVQSGEKIVICGPSGSGKSTLIRCVNALEAYQKGDILVGADRVDAEDKNVHKLRQRVGMVFQQFNLFAHMTVLENLCFGPVKALKLSKSEAEERARHFLTKVRIPEQADKYPSQLSGGQQQRVAIARAVIGRPKLLLADEPTGNVDDEIAMRLIYLIEELNRTGTTVLIATHNAGLIGRFKHPTLRLDAGELNAA